MAQHAHTAAAAPPRLRFQRPALPPTPAIEAYFRAAQERRWFSNAGPCCTLLADRLAAWIGQGVHVVPMANATLGLALALKELTRGRPGRSVLVPSFTFVATASAIDWAGLRPVFVDVDPDGWFPAPEALADGCERLGDEVACIMACSTFGAPAPAAVREGWARTAERHGVPLLVDSAAGLGSHYEDGTLLGALGHAEVFSMHATKPFAIGEGGLVTTRSAELAAALTRGANFGMQDGVVTGELGLNAKLAEWPAATALAVLDGFDEVLGARRRAAGRLVEGLEAAGLATQRTGGRPSWQFVPALAPSPAARAAVLESVTSASVEARRYFDPPLHRVPALAGAARIGELPVTDDIAARVLSLPMANDLGDPDIDGVLDAVRAGMAAA